PAAGTLIVAAGSTGVFGRVVAPEGLPTLTRAGLALVTVEYVALHEVFNELEIDVDYDALADAGLIVADEGVACFNLDEPDCDVVEHSEPAGGAPLGFRGAAPRIDPTSALNPECKHEQQLALGENNVKVEYKFRPTGNILGSVD